jgi:DNA-binding FadR family transcriptional regulator
MDSKIMRQIQLDETELKAAPSIDERVIEFIVSNKLSPGDVLPSVRELARRMEVPFNAVRDALHRAQSLGLVEIRARSRVVVRDGHVEPRLASIGQNLKIDLTRQDPTPVNVFHARAVIETETVRKAAARRLPEDLMELKRLLEEMRNAQHDRERFIRADEQFHLTIARIAGNPVLHTVLDTLLKSLRPGRLADEPAPERMRRSMASHEALYRAMLEADPDKAGKLVADHYQCHVRELLEFSNDEIPVAV